MKKIFILTLVFLGISTLVLAQSTIQEARNMSVGSVVTVTGIVTNGAELGSIRYFQDNTAGIAAYGSAVDGVNRGDAITITGTLKMYNQLLEIDPVTSLTVNSTENPLPDPIILTPAELSETYEARLVQVKNVTLPDAGAIFAQKKYEFISTSGESGYIYVKSSQTDIVGQTIPSGFVNLTGVLSQYDYTNPSAGYQLLPRTIEDIEQTSSIYLTSALINTNFTKSELDFSWTTNIAGTTQMYYGLSAETVKSNLVDGTGGSTDHNIELSGFTAGQIIWTQAFSVNENDTAFSGIVPFATISNSSGKITTYFNTPVDVSYSSGIDAIYLPQTIDDTLIEYINRAKYTIDLAIYNSNNDGLSNISNALKAAADRDVLVRVVGCGTTANFGVDELAGSDVKVLIGPNSFERTGIMHNKFVIFDAQSSDANDPLVWTGSTNFTQDQINLDANNVVIVQDQSLARTYQIEFEEMWGSADINPNAANSRFGFYKKNNTPHEFVIDGKRVECYFSPSDGVNAKIVEKINSTDNDLSIATMLLTRDEIADAIALNNNVNMVTDAEGNNGSTVNAILLNALGSTHYVFYPGPGIMHNKYMIIDQAEPTSDPLVLTGSHNWSAAADNSNDENTLIIHDADIANIYYQNFVSIYVASNGVITGIEDIDFNESDAEDNLLVFPNPVQNGNVNLSFSLNSDEFGTIQLIDITGKIVFNSQFKLAQGGNTLKFDFPDSYKGTYILRLITSKNIRNQKILFE